MSAMGRELKGGFLPIASISCLSGSDGKAEVDAFCQACTSVVSDRWRQELAGPSPILSHFLPGYNIDSFHPGDIAVLDGGAYGLDGFPEE